MIYEHNFICNFCNTVIDKKANVAYTDNGNTVIGENCICEFCYLNLKKAW